MQQRLERIGPGERGAGEPAGGTLVFAHANGYPVGSYRQFLEGLASEFRVIGYYHRPMWSEESAPELLDWNCFTDDLLETLVATQSEPVWMMGHSMGGVVSIQAAARQPELFRGLVLIDPVFPTPQALEAQRKLPAEAREQIPLVRKTLTRPNRFASRQEAFDFHRGKRVFADFSDSVLWDYINAGTRERPGGDYELAYCREWEAAAYRSGPEVWAELAAVKLPVLGLRGDTSTTLSPEAFALWGETQPSAELRNCSGGHLLPLERPGETAATVLEFLRGHTAD